MRDRIALWKQIFDTEENAISKAVSKMAWDLAVYSCVVEMVRQAPEEAGEKRLNGTVLDMLASGFWSSTMQGVRRLVEKETINGKRGVCSLGGLIRDAREHRKELTRELYVRDIAGLSYDYRRTREEYEEFVRSQVEQGVHSFWVPRELHYEHSAQRHAEFDWLSGRTPETASPDDIIREEVFDALDARLTRLTDVLEHVNVDIAHAATEASRAGRVLERFGLSDAKTALKEIAEVAQVVGNWFCYSGVGTVLPHPQFDQFAHLEAPLYAGDKTILQEVWDRFEEEAQSWHKVDPTEW